MRIDLCGLTLIATDDGVDMRKEETGEGFTVPYELVALVGEALKTVKEAA